MRRDDSRSDREIARVVGVDHKTVASVRGNFSPLAPQTAEEVVSNATPKGVVTVVPKADQDDKPDDHWKNDNPNVLFWDQPATCCYWNQIDQVVIRQQADWNEESDPYLRFAPENLPRLIARLQQIHNDWRSGQ